MAKKAVYMYKHTCAVCGVEFSCKHRLAKTCSYACAGVLRSGRNSYNYDSGAMGAGKTLLAGGYVGVRARGSRGYQYEHIVKAEAALGRPLPSGVKVHHVDGCRSNNNNDNLVICEGHAYHMLLHKRARVLAAGKVPGKHIYCSRCNSWLDAHEFLPSNRNSASDWCRVCRRLYDQGKECRNHGC